jgi:hypothetical protein
MAQRQRAQPDDSSGVPACNYRRAASPAVPDKTVISGQSRSLTKPRATSCRTIYQFCRRSAQAPVLPATRRCKRVYAGSLWRWFPLLCPVVVARCEDGWSVGLWSGGWLWAGLGPVAGEVGLAGQGGPAEDGGEFCCLGSLAFPFGLDGREH